MTVAGRAERARVARAFVGGVLGPGHPCGDDAAVLVSELSGNSVRPSRSRAAGGTVTVAVMVGAGLVRVEVTDRSGPEVPEPHRAGRDAEGGRGLQLVAGPSLSGKRIGIALMASRPPLGDDGLVPAAAGLPGASLEFEDAALRAVASSKVSRFGPAGLRAYDDPIRMTVKSVTLMTTAWSAVRRRACMLTVMGKGGSGG